MQNANRFPWRGQAVDAIDSDARDSKVTPTREVQVRVCPLRFANILIHFTQNQPTSYFAPTKQLFFHVALKGDRSSFLRDESRRQRGGETFNNLWTTSTGQILFPSLSACDDSSDVSSQAKVT